MNLKELIAKASFGGIAVALTLTFTDMARLRYYQWKFASELRPPPQPPFPNTPDD